MQHAEGRRQETEYRIQNTGDRIQNTEYRRQNTESNHSRDGVSPVSSVSCLLHSVCDFN